MELEFEVTSYKEKQGLKVVENINQPICHTCCQIVIFHILRTKAVGDYFWLKQLVLWTNFVMLKHRVGPNSKASREEYHEPVLLCQECGNELFSQKISYTVKQYEPLKIQLLPSC